MINKYFKYKNKYINLQTQIVNKQSGGYINICEKDECKTIDEKILPITNVDCNFLLNNRLILNSDNDCCYICYC